MSVDLNPSTVLAFPRPFNQMRRKTIIISNGHSEPVAFKVKTTAPRAYSVRPNAGRIEPGEKVEVSVMLQPMREEPPAGTKCRDKFLVQSALIQSDKEVLSLAEVWSSIESENKASIHEQKIKCAYSEGEEEDSPSSGAADKSTLIDGSPNLNVNGVSDPSSPSAANSTFQEADTTISHSSSSPESPPRATSGSLPPVELAPIVAGSRSGPSSSSVPSSSSNTHANANATSAASAISEKVSAVLPGQGELDQLKAEIKRLKDQLVEASNPTAVAGLRKRGGGVEEAGAQIKTAVKEQAPAGVALEVVAALCLGVFVLTYVFF